LVIHSQGVFRHFLRQHKNKLCQPDWPSLFFVHDRSICLKDFNWRQIKDAMNPVLPNWMKIGRETIQRGSTWWVISFDSTKAILQLIRDDPELILCLLGHSKPGAGADIDGPAWMTADPKPEIHVVRWPHPRGRLPGNVATMHKSLFLFARN
jgi:hypothetical protein